MLFMKSQIFTGDNPLEPLYLQAGLDDATLFLDLDFPPIHATQLHQPLSLASAF